ncbi:hypothetical protein [Pseudomonas putida]|uniref:hypothetical protein n=1 Tax=Pseudomonas putida TaxID=303 RepID=UPI000D3AD9B3|nr:hypothetical protein [Pseudomonas putida]PTV56781.1 hypothetical protein DBL03_20600 [Pseudomonas putida]
MTPNNDTFLGILSDIERDQKLALNEARKIERGRTPARLHRHLSWWIGITLMFFTVFFGGWAKLGDRPWAANAALICVIACYALILAQPFLLAWINRQALREALRLPFSTTMRISMQTPMEIDKLHFPRLKALPRLDLDIGLSSLKNEASFRERCTGWIIGPLEKVGLIPGCVAIVYATANVSSATEMATSLAWGNVILTTIGVFANVYIVRYQRMIALVELAIKHQELAEKARPSTLDAGSDLIRQAIAN